MTHRLLIINNALVATGNSRCAVENDGSDEWVAGHSAFERGISWMLGHHPWAFATVTTPPLPRLGVAASPRFANSFDLPPTRLLLRAVFHDGKALTRWGLVDDKLCCDPDQGITAEIVSRAPEAQWPPAFVEALTVYIESHILRGLNEDMQSGLDRERRADALVADAQFQSDTQTPGRAWYVSRSAARRRGFNRRG
jgi:hypothetical protein